MNVVINCRSNHRCAWCLSRCAAAAEPQFPDSSCTLTIPPPENECQNLSRHDYGSTAAISLAGSIVQFLGFATKLVSKGHALYKSSKGFLAESLSATTSFLDQQSLRSIAKSCDNVAKDLIYILKRLKIQGPHRTWKSVRQTFKSVWNKAHIDELRGRMEGYREQMIFDLVAVGRYGHAIKPVALG